MRPFLIVLMTACGGDTAPPPAVPPPEPAPEAAGHADYMDQHCAKVTEARDAVIYADLATAKASAEWIWKRGAPDGVPAEWDIWVSDMKAAAQQGMDAADLDAASMAIGQMGQACGNCHKAMSAVPTFASGDPPAGEDTVGIRMATHHWAADSMWKGLVGPSDDAWKAGVEALTLAPLDVAPLVKDGVIAEELEALAKGVGDAVISEETDRAKVYGTLIATCAGCHVKTRAEAKVDDLPRKKAVLPGKGAKMKAKKH